MLRVNNLNGFGNTAYGAMTTLRQADFLYLPLSSRVAIDGTGGFPDVGGNVGAVVNRGTRGGSLFATANGNRGTLQASNRISVKGTTSVQFAQTFTAATPSTIYTITAFIPRNNSLSYDRILSISETSGNDDNAGGSLGACLLLRDISNQNWGVFRRGSYRGVIAASDNVLTVFETILEPTQTTVCKDGGTDTVTSHGTLPDFSVASMRLLCSHETGGTYSGYSNSDVFVAAVFFTNPSANFRSRALSEVRTIAGILTP